MRHRTKLPTYMGDEGWEVPSFLTIRSWGALRGDDVLVLTSGDVDGIIINALHHAAEMYEDNAARAGDIGGQHRLEAQFVRQALHARDLAARLQDAYLVIYDQVELHEDAE